MNLWRGSSARVHTSAKSECPITSRPCVRVTSLVVDSGRVGGHSGNVFTRAPAAARAMTASDRALTQVRRGAYRLVRYWLRPARQPLHLHGLGGFVARFSSGNRWQICHTFFWSSSCTFLRLRRLNLLDAQRQHGALAGSQVTPMQVHADDERQRIFARIYPRRPGVRTACCSPLVRCGPKLELRFRGPGMIRNWGPYRPTHQFRTSNAVRIWQFRSVRTFGLFHRFGVHRSLSLR